MLLRYYRHDAASRPTLASARRRFFARRFTRRWAFADSASSLISRFERLLAVT